MKKFWIPVLILVGLEGVLFFAMRSPQPSSSLVVSPSPTSGSPVASGSSVASDSPVASAPQQKIQYRVYTLVEAEVQTLLIPIQSHFIVASALANGVNTLKNFAEKDGAIAALNGGFFDPSNQKSASYVTVQGQQVADPHQNEQLINNPELAPYLDKIFDRTEFRRYQCGQTLRYDITVHSTPVPAGCQLVDALGAGPSLLPELTLEREGFLARSDGKVIRDSLSNSKPHPRTAVGITRDGSILWVLVAQKPQTPTTSGMSLQALAAFMKTLDVEKAMNLDGGGSSSLYYNGKTVYGEIDKQGNPVERSVNSALLVRPN